MLDFYYEQHQARTLYVRNRHYKFGNAEHSIQSDLGFSTRRPKTTTASDNWLVGMVREDALGACA